MFFTGLDRLMRPDDGLCVPDDRLLVVLDLHDVVAARAEDLAAPVLLLACGRQMALRCDMVRRLANRQHPLTDVAPLIMPMTTIDSSAPIGNDLLSSLQSFVRQSAS